MKRIEDNLICLNLKLARFQCLCWPLFLQLLLPHPCRALAKVCPSAFSLDHSVFSPPETLPLSSLHSAAHPTHSQSLSLLICPLSAVLRSSWEGSAPAAGISCLWRKQGEGSANKSAGNSIPPLTTTPSLREQMEPKGVKVSCSTQPDCDSIL